MKKSKAMKWVKALRSGKYKQAIGNLKELDWDGNCIGHCCLGVLGEISRVNPESLLVNNVLNSYGLQEKCGIGSADGTPTDEYDRKLNVKIRVGNKYKEFADLAAANDEGVSFKSIASWIEKNYKLL